MSTLRQPLFRYYRNSEFLQYMKDVLKLVDSYDVELLQLTEQRNALALSIETLTNVFEPEPQPQMTAVLADLDAKRDSLFIGIKHLLEGNAHHFDLTKQEAAKRLLFHLQSYGKNIPYMNYQAETAVIASMLSEWQTETNLQEVVTLLELSEWVDTLQQINVQFNEQYLARVSEMAATTAPSFSTLRANAKSTYRTLVSHVKAYMTLHKSTQYTQLYHQIYELAKQYNQVVKVRSKD